MKEIKIFNLFFDPNLGFDDQCIQDWLGAERILVKQQSFLLDNHQGQTLVVIIESELLKITDPYLRSADFVQNKPKLKSAHHKPSQTFDHRLSETTLDPANLTQELKSLQQKKESRKRKRLQYKRDTEAALIRLDDRGRLLVDLLRSWRISMAKELAIPVYELGSDLFFCEVAQVRPSTLASLKELPHCKPRFLKLLGQELLILLQQFESEQESLWQTQQAKEKEEKK